MIEVRLADGQTTIVNPSHIRTVQPSGEGSVIAFSDGGTLFIQETYEEFKKALKAFEEDGCFWPEIVG